MKKDNVLKLGIIAVLGFTLLLFGFQNKPVRPVNISKIELGELLFFEKALSLDSSISCASCHIPAFAFSDTLPFSIGVNGMNGKRNTPSIMNVASGGLLFYDGRAKNIEDQVHFPIEDPNEMNVSYELIILRLNLDPSYRAYFLSVFKTAPNKKNVAEAIAAFERSLETFNTPFDDYMSDLPSNMSESAKRGREIFLSDKSKCFDCHFGPDFTGNEFKNIGLYDGGVRNDQGRFLVSKDSNDLGKFKVPGLRNVEITAPYMHDGSLQTLEAVIEYYSDPSQFVKNPIQIDSLMLKPKNFTDNEKIDLLNFLKSLTDRQFLNR